MKDWKVFLFYSSHTDPGWHDLPERVIAEHARYLDQVVHYCDETRDEPPHRRFVFTVESAWPVDYYERHRSPEQFARLMDCCRRGQVEIGAIYAGVHSDLCGHEELARLTQYATGLRRRYGVPVDAAMLNDVSDGYPSSLPQILARSGIRGIAFGPGGKAMFKGIMPELPRIYEWRTPDGSSVLVGWTPGKWTYTDWTEAGFRGEQTLEEFERLGAAYPYDAIFRHGGKGDNAPPSLDALAQVRAYQEPPHSFDIRMACVGEFVDYIDAHAAGRIPVVQGANPHVWADGTLSLARETALHRRNQSALIAAETLAALDCVTGGATPYPAERIVEAYRNLHFYSDHTWGLDLETGVQPGSRLGHNVSYNATADADAEVTAETEAGAPVFDDWMKNWDAKRAYAHQARHLIDEIGDRALGALCRRAAVPGSSLVVWNTLSWPRTDVVRVAWPEGYDDGLTLVDVRDGREIPWQRDADEAGAAWLVCVANAVPALGYACYRVERGGPRAPAHPVATDNGTVIENRFYRVEVDPHLGTVRSIRDKELDKELVDQGARYGFNQYIHADVTEGYEGVGQMEKAGFAHGEGTRYLPDVIESIDRETGPVFATIAVRARVTSGPAPATVTRTIALYHDLKRIDLLSEVDKKASLRKEQVYVAFPFAVEGEVALRLEEPYGVMRWDHDILPGCWRGFSSVQHWLDVSGEDYGVTWSSLDAPVVSAGGIHGNEWDPAWHKTYVPDNGHIYSYVMSNVWNCNYALWQGGLVGFAYRVTSHAGRCDQAAASRFGWGNASPLLARLVERQDGSPAAVPLSGLRVAPDNVQVTALKRADDGDGWIVRLYETRGAATEASLSLTAMRPATVCLATLAEEDLVELPLDGDTVRAPLTAHELVTLRVR